VKREPSGTSLVGGSGGINQLRGTSGFSHLEENVRRSRDTHVREKKIKMKSNENLRRSLRQALAECRVDRETRKMAT
jgi:hypothetical protein